MLNLPSLLLAMSLGDALPPPADHVLNPDFATGVSDWRYYLDGGTHGQLSWNPAAGAPDPGSARVGSVWHDAGTDSWAQCVRLPVGPFVLNAAVASELLPGNSCELRIKIVNQADCNITAGIVREVAAFNTRNDGVFETIGIADAVPVGAGAAAIYLSHVRSASASVGNSFCNFDHIQLNGDPLFDTGFEH